MNDLSISLRYYTSAALKRASSEFKSDPSDTSPGWFVEAYENEGYDRIAKLTRVGNLDAVYIANALDDCSGTQRSITAAVTRQNKKHEEDGRLRRARTRRLERLQRRKAFLENQLVETERALAQITAEESDGPDA